MRLAPDLLFANGREVSGHVVSIASATSDVIRLPDKPA